MQIESTEYATTFRGTVACVISSLSHFKKFCVLFLFVLTKSVSKQSFQSSGMICLQSAEKGVGGAKH